MDGQREGGSRRQGDCSLGQADRGEKGGRGCWQGNWSLQVAKGWLDADGSVYKCVLEVTRGLNCELEATMELC